ncbi:MAG: hypothetical protein KGZ49_08045 [Syntrophaceae bacterium]|nr:hypothetical protein [Syntrophaceae bacterium]
MIRGRFKLEARPQEWISKGDQATRKPGGRVPEHQNIRETKEKKLFNLIPGYPDIHNLIT